MATCPSWDSKGPALPQAAGAEEKPPGAAAPALPVGQQQDLREAGVPQDPAGQDEDHVGGVAHEAPGLLRRFFFDRCESQGMRHGIKPGLG